MPEPLKVRIKHNPDGSAALTCTRADGSTTWQRQNGSLGMVFPAHDLTHFAVESTLGYTHGFYGLIAQGWDISDFASPWSRGPIPPEAREVEFIVGMLDIERRHGAAFTSEEFQEQGRLYAESRINKAPVVPPPLTDEQLARVRALRAKLLSQWFAVQPGSALELTFAPAPAPAPRAG